MSLSDWLKFGWLTEHQPTASEIRDLFALVERDLADAEVEALSADWRLNIAYNAALQAATAALAASGFRASRESHHYRVEHPVPRLDDRSAARPRRTIRPLPQEAEPRGL